MHRAALTSPPSFSSCALLGGARKWRQAAVDVLLHFLLVFKWCAFSTGRSFACRCFSCVKCSYSGLHSPMKAPAERWTTKTSVSAVPQYLDRSYSDAELCLRAVPLRSLVMA